MSRRVESIIKMIRQHCGQVNYSTDTSGNPTAGITDELILEYLNDGQELLQSRIIEQYPKEFLTTKEITVDGSASYSVDDNVMFNNKWMLVEYTSTGNDKDYYPLDQISLREVDYTNSRDVDSYARRGGLLIPSPKATSTSSKFRITYYRALDKLDIRRGLVASTSATTVVLTVDAEQDLTGIFDREDYICVVDNLGVVQDYSLQISSYSDPTITIPSHTFVGGAGDHVVVGKYATTHSDLPDGCERFIKTYAQQRVFETMNSKKAGDEENNVELMLRDIIDSYKEEDHDIKHIPIIDLELFT